VDRLAKEGVANIPFPKPMIDKGLTFSFSGLKSAVSRYVEANQEFNKADVAASFVQTVIDVLITKSQRALKEYPSKSFAMVGGVSASPQIREAAADLCNKMNLKLCLPPLKWSTDNAAMIALAAFDYLRLGIIKPSTSDLHLTIEDF
jgi:N6-L-threonylcarbamoyladenine synthase